MTYSKFYSKSSNLYNSKLSLSLGFDLFWYALMFPFLKWSEPGIPEGFLWKWPHQVCCLLREISPRWKGILLTGGALRLCLLFFWTELNKKYGNSPKRWKSQSSLFYWDFFVYRSLSALLYLPFINEVSLAKWSTTSQYNSTHSRPVMFTTKVPSKRIDTWLYHYFLVGF